MAATSASPHTGWPRRVFAAAVTVQSLLAAAQPLLAGGFLAGHYELLRLHSVNGRLVGYAAILQLTSAVLLWRVGRGPGWPALVSLALLVAVFAQIALGFARMLSIHVPLGVAVVVGTAFLLVRCWRPNPWAKDAR